MWKPKVGREWFLWELPGEEKGKLGAGLGAEQKHEGVGILRGGAKVGEEGPRGRYWEILEERGSGEGTHMTETQPRGRCHFESGKGGD